MEDLKSRVNFKKEEKHQIVKSKTTNKLFCSDQMFNVKREVENMPNDTEIIPFRPRKVQYKWTNSKFSQNIYFILKKKKISSVKLSKILKVGLGKAYSQRGIRRVISGENRPDLLTVEHMAYVLGVNPGHLAFMDPVNFRELYK